MDTDEISKTVGAECKLFWLLGFTRRSVSPCVRRMVQWAADAQKCNYYLLKKFSTVAVFVCSRPNMLSLMRYFS